MAAKPELIAGQFPSSAATSFAGAQLGNPNRLLMWFMLSIPLVWVLGIGPFAAFCFTVLFLRHRSHPGFPEIALLCMGAALLCSLVLAAGRGDPVDRIAAAAYNLVVLTFACIALNFGRQVDLTFMRTPILRYPVIGFFIAYVAFIAAAYILGAPTARTGISFPSLVAGQLGEDLPGLLGYYAEARVTGPDWNSGSSYPRPLAFGIYFNEGALMFLLCGIIAILASRQKILAYAMFIGLVAGLLLLRGRMLFLAAALALLIALIARAPASRDVRLLVASFGLIGAILFCFVNPDMIDAAIDAIISSREASSATRFLSYSVAFDVTWRESPFTGLGIKPRDDALISDFSVPIGSHSTIVSIFTKGGLLALLPLLAFYGSVVVAAFRLLFLDHAAAVYRTAQAALGAAALIVLAWMLVEDFDAPVYGSMLAFLVIGSMFGLLDRLRRYEALRKSAAPTYPTASGPRG